MLHSVVVESQGRTRGQEHQQEDEEAEEEEEEEEKREEGGGGGWLKTEDREMRKD